ncbi:hypothetical protein KJ641_02145 [Patescibacteria group bacterium]|nr:hypothetical protein [Patescibacteria group bacterium]MBU1895648.1 hypothetical protein [Patescibacteria group bacterium]
METKQQPIIIISGPSGAGEDSIINALAKQMPIERVITTSTREMRARESQGDPYYFITREDFKEGIADGRFFEYAEEYNGQYYGVTFEEIERIKNSGKIGIWKIEYKGVIYAKKLMPEIMAIFINAPLEVLENRIRRRDNVSDEYVAERMAYTKEWLKYKDVYDFVVENEDGKFDESVSKVREIIESVISIDKKDTL